jgi:hypothetical protein
VPKDHFIPFRWRSVLPSSRQDHWFRAGDEFFLTQSVRLEGPEGLRHVSASGVLVEGICRR